MSKKSAAGAPRGVGRQGGSAPSDPQRDEVAPSPVLGIAIIIVTVLLGILVMAKGFSRDTIAETNAGPPTTLEPGIAFPDRDAAPTTTSPGSGTTIAKTGTTKVPPKQIKVVVANGVDAAKVIAGPNAKALEALGYVIAGTADLPQPSDRSFIYYSGDLQAEAQAIAQALGLPMSTATVMPDKPPTNLAGAQVLVVIGKDKGA